MSSANVKRVDYFYATVTDRPGEAYKLLSQLASAEVNLHAFSIVPIGAEATQLVLFPENVARLARAAEEAGLVLAGPQRAFLITGDDELGALVGVHRKLFDSQVNIYASNGVTDGGKGYGYIVYVRPEEFDHAAQVLGV